MNRKQRRKIWRKICKKNKIPWREVPKIDKETNDKRTQAILKREVKK